MKNTIELVARAIADCPIDLCDENDEYFAPAQAAIDAHIAAIDEDGFMVVPKAPRLEATRKGEKWILESEYKAALAEQGMVIVPREPSEVMHDAGKMQCVDGIDLDQELSVWQAMITAHEKESTITAAEEE